MPFVSVWPICCAYVRGEMGDIPIIIFFFNISYFRSIFYMILLSILIFAVYPAIRKMKNIDVTDISCELKLEKELFRNQERKVERAP